MGKGHRRWWFAALLCWLLWMGGTQGVMADADSAVRLVVQLDAPPLARYHGGLAGYAPTSAQSTGRARLDVQAQASRAYLGYLDREQDRLALKLAEAMPQAEVAYRYGILFNGLTVAVEGDTRKAEAALRALPGVRAVYRERAYELALNQSVSLIEAPVLWETLGGVENAGRGVKIAILDTGIHLSNPFFRADGFTYPTGYPQGDTRYTTPKVIVARAYFRPDDPPHSSEPPNPLDGSFAHGSHVAGIAAGVADTVSPIGAISGVAPQAWLMNYKLFYYSESGQLNAYTPEILACLEDVVADGAQVCNGSWGGVADFNTLADPMVQATEAMVEAGIVAVFAAGNEGPNGITVNTPGSAPSAIAVANTTTNKGGRADAMASGSSRGPALGLALKPDIAAPGTSIYSAFGSRFSTLSGTSMASPHVAGAAALLRQLYPHWTPQQIKAALMNTAKTSVTDNGSQASVMAQGAGRVDLAAAQAPGLLISPPSHSFGQLEAGRTVTAVFDLYDVMVGGLYTVTTESASGLVVTPSAQVVALAPDATGQIELALTVPPGIAPGDYEGRLWLIGPSKRVHVPWWVRVVAAEPRADILLLDDDGSSLGSAKDYAAYYIKLMNDCGLSYELWDVGRAWQQALGQRAGALPTAAYMQGFRAVVWFTGDSTMTYSKIGARTGDRLRMLDYVQSGGRLLVTGQDFSGYALGSEDTAHLVDIGLGVEIGQADAFDFSAQMVPIAGIVGAGGSDLLRPIQLDLSVPDVLSPTLDMGAGNAAAVDELLAIEEYDAQAVLRALLPGGIDGGAVALVKSSEPTLEQPLLTMPPGRALYFAFGLESINDHTGYTTRATLFERALGWLEGAPQVALRDASAAHPYDLVTLQAIFTATVPGNEAVRYRWDLGDGSAIFESQSDAIVYIYGQAGAFHPQVEAIDGYGHHALSERATVIVEPAPTSWDQTSYLPFVSTETCEMSATWNMSAARPAVDSDISGSWVQVDKAQALPGDILRYAVVISNTGSVTASVSVRDDLPQTPYALLVPGSLLASNGTPIFNDVANSGYGRITWSADVGPGQSAVINFELEVNALAPSGTEIVNTVLFGDSTAHLTWQDQVSTLVVWPDIATPAKLVDKDEVRPGERLTYRLVARNHGAAAASVKIKDALPRTDAVIFEPLSLQANRGIAYLQAEPNDGYGVVSWSGQIPPAQAVTVTYQLGVLAQATPGAMIQNRAVITEQITAQTYQVEAMAEVIAPRLVVDKRVNRQTAVPSDVLTYEIVAVNEGNGAATLRMTDTLSSSDAQVLTDSLTASSGVLLWDPVIGQAGALTWQGDLEAAQSLTLTYQVSLAGLTAEQVVTNHVLFLDVNSGWGWQDQASCQVLIADLSPSTKTVDKAHARPGETLTYTVMARNRGSAVAALRVDDLLPTVDGLELITMSLASSLGQVTYDPTSNNGYGSLVWQGSLAPTQSLTLTFGMRLAADMAVGEIITNRVFFAETSTERMWQDVATTTVVASELTGDKSVDIKRVHPGESMRYALVARNEGNVATQVALSDWLPRSPWTELSVGTLTATQGVPLWQPATNQGYGRIDWRGELAAGQGVTVTYRLDVSPLAPPAALFINEAVFTDTVSGQRIEDKVFSRVIASDISSSHKIAEKRVVRPGGELGYALIAENSGNITTTVHVQDSLPRQAGLTLVEGSLTASAGQPSWSPMQNDGYGMVRWMDLLGPQQVVTITYRLAVSDVVAVGTILTNTALFGDDIGRQVEASVTTQVATSDLSASEKVVDKSVTWPGDTLTYTLLARNQSAITTTVRITDLFPAEIQVLSSTLAASSGQPYLTAEALTWEGQIGAGDHVLITYAAVIGANALGDTVTNAVVFHDLAQGERYTDTVSSRILRPDIVTSRKVVDKWFAGAGETLHYSLIGRNGGDLTATLQITDVLPNSDLIQVEAGSLTVSQGVAQWLPEVNNGYGLITWSGQVGPSQIVSVEFDATLVEEGIVAQGSLVNQAQFRELTTGQMITDAVTTELLLPDVSATLQVNKEMAGIGDRIRYTLRAVNEGDFAAALVVTDTLPALSGLRLLPSSLVVSSGSAQFDPVANAGFGVIIWQGRLAADEAVEIAFELEVQSTVVPGATAINRAVFTERSRGQRIEREVRTEIRAPSLAQSLKRVDRPQAHPGERLTYTITVVNSGNMAASVRISDSLPHMRDLSLLPESLQASEGQLLWDPTANEGYGLLLWVGFLMPQEVVTFTFQLELDRSATPNRVVTNTALFRDMVHGRGWESSASTLILPPETRYVYVPRLLRTQP